MMSTVKTQKRVTISIILLATHIVPIIAYAEKSIASKVIALTQSIDTGESSIKEQADLFIADLRKKLPHFSEEQLESMKRAYEDTILENVTAPQIAGEKTENETGLTLDIKPVSETSTTATNSKSLNKQLSHLVSNSSTVTKEQKNQLTSALKEEAGKTIIILTVKRGDTLSDIAQRNYGDPDMYIAIYEENKDKLSSPDSTPEGVSLIVPVIDSSMKKKFYEMKQAYEAKKAREKKQNK